MEGGGSFPVPLSLSWAGILYDDPVFAPLCVSEDSLRRKAVEALVARLLTWPLPMVCALSPALASLCIDCPFQDVRSALYTYFDSIYHSIGEGVPPDGRLEAGDEDVVALLRRAWSVVTAAPASPSKFIAIDKLVPFPPATLASEEGETFETCFLAEGHVSNLAKVLAWHPRYLKPLAQAQSVIMRDDGPLPVPWRHYVALCASSRHSCAVLARRCKAEFLRSGGEPEWLYGLSAVPPKLAGLAELNALLAHQPWRVSPQHIRDLLALSWSINELVHAIVIMASFHALCSSVMGLGILPEVDIALTSTATTSDAVVAPVPPTASLPSTAPSGGGSDGDGAPVSAPASTTAAAADADAASSPRDAAPLVDDTRPLLDGETGAVASFTAQLVELLKSHGVEGGGDSVSDEGEEEGEGVEATQAGKDDVYENAGAGAVVRIAPVVCGGGEDDFASFAGPPLLYCDFQNTKWDVLRAQDFCWEDHGFPVLAKYFPSAAECLDSLFDVANTLTYNNLGEVKEVTETLPFRQAVWFYVHRIFGLSNDDYDYKDVNRFVHVKVKTFIKQCVCSPENMGDTDFDLFAEYLRPDERCHVNVIAIEARKQAELLFAMRAVMMHMNA